jgi:hypothetical protein
LCQSLREISGIQLNTGEHCRFAHEAQPRLGLHSFQELDPRVAALRGNPGLSYTAASRLEEEPNPKTFFVNR